MNEIPKIVVIIGAFFTGILFLSAGINLRKKVKEHKMTETVSKGYDKEHVLLWNNRYSIMCIIVGLALIALSVCSLI